MEITIGADPEIFLFDKKKDTHVSAHDLVPGTKKEPHKLKHGAVQLDGTAVEFNINPAKTYEEFEYNIRSTLDEIRKMIPSRFSFSFVPAVKYDLKYFQEVVPQSSKELGCDPDFNAWTSTPIPNRRPNPTRGNQNLRTGAGHIHVGWTEKKDPFDETHYWDCRQLITNLNAVWYYHKPIFDKDTLRYQLYGSDGAFRPKPYGCEFRVPSNAWLNYPKIWKWIFSFHKDTFETLQNGKSISHSFYYNTYYDKNRVTHLRKQAANVKITQFPSDWEKEVASW